MYDQSEIATQPKILPARLREAREASGHTLETLAEKIGVTKQAVAQYETGLSTPSGSVLNKIISTTAQPLTFFLSAPVREGEPSTPYWRSLARMDLIHRRRLARRLQWASDIATYIGEFIEVPPVALPTFDFDPEATDWIDQVEHCANLLRNYWKLGDGPIRNLGVVLEQHGVVLVREPVACKDMDGVSCWVGGRPYILLSGEVESGPRDLFNLAHELGHIVLHSSVDVDSCNLSRIEAQANRFAGAFLIPKSSLRREYIGSSLGHLLSLKERWGVAMSAIAYRLKDIGIVSGDRFGSIMKQMNARNLRRMEPLDDAFDVCRPQLLRQSIEMLIEHGVQSREQIEDALALNLQDVESLCGLRSGYLYRRVVPLNFRQR